MKYKGYTVGGDNLTNVAGLLFLCFCVILVSVLCLHWTSLHAVLSLDFYLLFQAILAQYAVSNIWVFNQVFFIGFYIIFFLPSRKFKKLLAIVA